ncbi:hypothetical protein GCM10009759_43400 [Kitasatospora saccharophila]|uniref:DUF4333 domain-containing protein n=1 Tax=Kitasatospora saccharophila TaxID=407973 RepID=A0ABN2X7M7_9ACTN
MRLSKTFLVGALAAVLLTSACSSDADSGAGSGSDSALGSASTASSGSPTPTSNAGAALPVAVTGPVADVYLRSGDSGDALKVTPAPDRSAPLVEKVEFALREDLLSKARTPGETTAKCPDGVTQKAGAVSRCVATFEGAEVPYEVKISDSYKEGSMIISYTKTPKKGLLVAKTIQAQLYDQYGPESGYEGAGKLACQEMPVAKAYDFETDTGFTCQYWSEHAAGGKPGYTTLKVRMNSRNADLQTVR